jgi:hypothetical protein
MNKPERHTGIKYLTCPAGLEVQAVRVFPGLAAGVILSRPDLLETNGAKPGDGVVGFAFLDPHFEDKNNRLGCPDCPLPERCRVVFPDGE